MIFVPKNLLEKELSPSALKINICLRTKGPNFSWKISDIVLLSGLSERTVRTELKNMINKNLVISSDAAVPNSDKKIKLYKCVYDSSTKHTTRSRRRGKHSARKASRTCAGENTQHDSCACG